MQWAKSSGLKHFQNDGCKSFGCNCRWSMRECRPFAFPNSVKFWLEHKVALQPHDLTCLHHRLICMQVDATAKTCHVYITKVNFAERTYFRTGKSASEVDEPHTKQATYYLQHTNDRHSNTTSFKILSDTEFKHPGIKPDCIQWYKAYNVPMQQDGTWIVQ